MKFNPFCMCCAVSKQEQNIRSFQNMDNKVEYMKKVNRSKIHEIDNVIYHKEYYLL